MIEVRIRHEDDTESVPFCAWDVHRLDDVLPLLQRWGVVYDHDADNWELAGQFVVTATVTYFEVVISAPAEMTA